MEKLTLSIATIILALQLTACTDKEKPELKPVEIIPSASTNSTVDTPTNPTAVAPAPEEPKLDETTTETMTPAVKTQQDPSEKTTEPKQPATDEEEEKEPECE